MTVRFKTNVYAYKTNCWPENLDTPPRIGESVLVVPSFESYFTSKKLPLRMEVVDVTWTHIGVVCELWYKQIDLQAAKQSEINLFP